MVSLNLKWFPNVCGDWYNTTKNTRESLCRTLEYSLSLSFFLSLFPFSCSERKKFSLYPLTQSLNTPLLTPDVWVFLSIHQAILRQTPTRCFIVQLNSDTMQLEIVSDPTG
jgi:hypothetical protein